MPWYWNSPGGWRTKQRRRTLYAAAEAAYFEHDVLISEVCQPKRTFAYLQGVQAMSEREGGSGRVLVAAATPWLIRWLLLRDGHHRFGPPGKDTQVLIHVICPVDNCHVDDWVTKYEPRTVAKCSQHRPQLPRLPLKPCPDCHRSPGYHQPPRGS